MFPDSSSNVRPEPGEAKEEGGKRLLAPAEEVQQSGRGKGGWGADKQCRVES